MNKPALGKLMNVDLRDYWRNEAQEFTPWLARPENIGLLAKAVGLELEVEAQEQGVGPFRADILCKETTSDGWVLIENQLEPTDHSHLGQVLTYAAGLRATTIIWVAQSFTNEHRAALDWLNEITGEAFSFLGVEIELWRIGDSPPAPKFNIVSKPNDWFRSVQDSARHTGLTEAKQLQLAFWVAFKAFMERKSQIRCQRPAPQYWMAHPIGRSGVIFASVAAVWSPEGDEGEIRVDLLLSGPHAKSYFAQLEADRAAIETEVGKSLTWKNPPNAQMCRVFSRRPADITDRANWPEYQEWLLAELQALMKVFGTRIRALRTEDLADDGGSGA